MFKMRQDCRAWFSHIAGPGQAPLKTYFDAYYLCALVGIGWGRRTKAEDDEGAAKDLVDNFVAPYDRSRGMILGLLLSAYLADQGISMDQPQAVQRVCGELFSGESRASLSSVGYEIMNEYASGGFVVLADEFPAKPHTLTEFLVNYERILTLGVSGNDIWSAPRGRA